MTKDEKFVKSIHPNAEIQGLFSFGRVRVVSEPSIKGYWLGDAFNIKSKTKWKSAAEYVRLEMLRKLES